MSNRYFQYLSAAKLLPMSGQYRGLRESGDDYDDESPIEQSSNDSGIRTSSFNEGYYSSFFTGETLIVCVPCLFDVVVIGRVVVDLELFIDVTTCLMTSNWEHLQSRRSLSVCSLNKSWSSSRVNA